MIGSLLLVFREVLEAALIVSIVAAATQGVPGRFRWIGAGLALGLLGAITVAISTGAIADSLSGAGQEWFNAGVLLTAVVMIAWHVIWMTRHGRELSMQMNDVGSAVATGNRPLTALFFVVTIAILREGSEVVLFGYGLLASGSSPGSVLLGGGLGVISGIAVGFAMYFGLMKIPMRHFFGITNLLLALLASGLASSAAGYLTQVDALPSLVDPIWDTSWLLNNDSVLGQILHVLIGYTAEPSGMQLIFYGVTLTLLLLGMKTLSPNVKTVSVSPQLAS